MKFQISLVLLLAAAVISFQDEDGGAINITARKHYGLSFHSKCIDYVKSFTCMTTCKSIGFQIFRMDFRCKCSCHGLKTTTILPFFKWRTNGTTKTVPSTQSPNLYHVAGTLSPFPRTKEEATNATTIAPEISSPLEPDICIPNNSTVTKDASGATTENMTTTVIFSENTKETGTTGANGSTSDKGVDGSTTDTGATVANQSDNNTGLSTISVTTSNTTLGTATNTSTDSTNTTNPTNTTITTNSTGGNSTG